jgi:hypothetical protein
MKTDLKKLQHELNAGIETLEADAVDLGKAKGLTVDQAADHLRQQQLLGHSISGLRGVAASLQGLLGEEPAPVARKKAGLKTARADGIEKTPIPTPADGVMREVPLSWNDETGIWQ